MSNEKSYILLKWGEPFKSNHFTNEFMLKHKDFIDLYVKMRDYGCKEGYTYSCAIVSANVKRPRNEMSNLGRMIIKLVENKELKVQDDGTGEYLTKRKDFYEYFSSHNIDYEKKDEDGLEETKNE